MFPLSERVIFLVLIISNGILTFSGLVALIMGIVRSASNLKDDLDYSTGSTSIITGVVDIITGASGVAGALLKNKKLLILNAVLLGMAIAGNIFIMFSVGLVEKKEIAESVETMQKDIVLGYGNNTVKELQDYTTSVDAHQKSHGCCGFTGIDGENIFLKSPWYRQNSGRTLPDSCCLKNSIECWNAENIKSARDGGFVKPLDCADKFRKDLLFHVYFIMAQTIITTLLLIFILGFCILCLMQDMGGGGDSN